MHKTLSEPNSTNLYSINVISSATLLRATKPGKTFLLQPTIGEQSASIVRDKPEPIIIKRHRTAHLETVTSLRPINKPLLEIHREESISMPQ